MANRYWVGGTANWDATAGTKWALTSGGVGGQAVPTSADDVFFDANSGASTVTIPSGTTVNCRNLNCTGFTGALAAAPYDPTPGGATVNIYGSLYFSAGMTTINFTPSHLYFLSTSQGNTITTNGHSLLTGEKFDYHCEFNGVGGSWIFQDAATISIVLTAGTLDFNGQTITLYSLLANGTGTKGILLRNSLINLYNGAIGGGGFSVWNVNATGTTFSTAGAVLKVVDTTTTFTYTFTGGGFTYDMLWSARGSLAYGIAILDSNTFKHLKDTGTAAHSILFVAGSTQTIYLFEVTGSAGNVVTVNSCNSSAGASTATHALTKAGNGVISSDYLNIQHSVASPASTWYAGANSVNNQGVATIGSGWTFTVPPSNVISPFPSFQQI